VDISVSETGELAVHRVICVIDAGYIVNPSIVEAQMEGAVVYGLGAVLYGQITLQEGQVQQSNFHDYRALRMNEMPQVETYFLSSGKQILPGVGWRRRARNAPARTSSCQRRVRGDGPAYTLSLPLANHELKHNDSQ
jgi:isoquinoline 1-oxidoreductase beta subunit